MQQNAVLLEFIIAPRDTTSGAPVPSQGSRLTNDRPKCPGLLQCKASAQQQQPEILTMEHSLWVILAPGNPMLSVICLGLGEFIGAAILFRLLPMNYVNSREKVAMKWAAIRCKLTGAVQFSHGSFSRVLICHATVWFVGEFSCG